LPPVNIAAVIGLIQRVTHAQVAVDGRAVAQIQRGLLALVGVRRGDDDAAAARLLERMLGYRVFPDEVGRMNLSLRDVGGGLLLVPQFTLAADTRQGLRAGFSTAADPGEARRLFERLVDAAQAVHPDVGAGVFGAAMQVTLTNDGPVTFWLETPSAT
jgi:D-tyrosyl-tRNA(Tyr) deacylase